MGVCRPLRVRAVTVTSGRVDGDVRSCSAAPLTLLRCRALLLLLDALLLRLLLALLVDEATFFLARIGGTAWRLDRGHVGPAFLANMPLAGVALHLPWTPIPHTAFSSAMFAMPIDAPERFSPVFLRPRRRVTSSNRVSSPSVYL